MSTSPTLRLPTGMRDSRAAGGGRAAAITENAAPRGLRTGASRASSRRRSSTRRSSRSGSAARGARSAGHFVEPTSGQVVALRPTSRRNTRASSRRASVTEPGPVRLSYEGTVVRLDARGRGSASSSRRASSWPARARRRATSRSIALGVAALRAAGLPRPTIDLGHLGLAREVMNSLELPEPRWKRRARRIAKRDGAGLGGAAARGARLRRPSISRAACPSSRARPTAGAAAKSAPRPGIKRALRRISAIVAAVEARGVDARLHVELGEVRGFDYYTGVRFQAFVARAPDAVAARRPLRQSARALRAAEPGRRLRLDVEAAAGARSSARAHHKENQRTHGRRSRRRSAVGRRG